METFEHSVCELHGVTCVLGVWIEDDEFVIYRQNQQRLEYLVEFKV